MFLFSSLGKSVGFYQQRLIFADAPGSLPTGTESAQETGPDWLSADNQAALAAAGLTAKEEPLLGSNSGTPIAIVNKAGNPVARTIATLGFRPEDKNAWVAEALAEYRKPRG